MEKKSVYMAPAIEEIDSKLVCTVAQGASGVEDPEDNTGDI